MSETAPKRTCSAQCTTHVPPELGAMGLCVSHFTFNTESTCADLHRQIAMRGIPPERQAEVSVYLEERAALLAKITSNTRLSDEMKRRVLTAFLALMNLRDTMERAAASTPPARVRKAASIVGASSEPASAVA